MKAQDIMQALNYLDDEFIVDAQKLADSKKSTVTPIANTTATKAAKPKNKARRIALISSLSAAAALIVLVGGVFMLTQKNMSDSDSSKPAVRRADKDSKAESAVEELEAAETDSISSEETQGTKKNDSASLAPDANADMTDLEKADEDAEDSEAAGSDQKSEGTISVKPINAYTAEDLTYWDVFEINGDKYTVEIEAVDTDKLDTEIFRNESGNLVFYDYPFAGGTYVAIEKLDGDGNAIEYLRAKKVD